MLVTVPEVMPMTGSGKVLLGIAPVVVTPGGVAMMMVLESGHDVVLYTPLRLGISLHAGDGDAAWAIVDGPGATVGGDDGGCAASGGIDGCERSVTRVPGGYRERVAEENVVVAVLLPIGEARSAIAARGAGSEIARPDLGELQAVLPADNSRLAVVLGTGRAAPGLSVQVLSGTALPIWRCSATPAFANAF